MSQIKRIYVEKKKGFDGAAGDLLDDLTRNLGITNLTGLRRLIRYDISGITDDEYMAARTTILSEPPVDTIYEEQFETDDDEIAVAVEYLPGQYDQRADSAAQCIQIVTLKSRPTVKTAEIIVLKGSLTDDELTKIKKYLINPVDSREAAAEIPGTLDMKITPPDDVEIVNGFINKNDKQLEKFRKDRELAMSREDLKHIREYFKNDEKRDPTITEIKLLDTYWSDHCRHTTFHTRIDNVEFESSPLTAPMTDAYNKFLDACKRLSPDREPDICLMNLATISTKELRADGRLDDLEVSGEINACSIIRDVVVNGSTEKWLIMFKNETHNHPTEIEPYGGAATCLGGAIRDPLSGRAFVYQAMRVTGSGDPTGKIEDTLPGKLPQRKITTEAAHGYSSYGNQIGLPTGQVTEVYHPGYMAKRMEVGAVVGAVAQKNVVREEPVEGDIILLVGGRTGRDGIGGATGSSKEHTEDSIHTAGAEVQKGNAPEERKLQRLFRNPDAARMIRKCNDFGAGGVSVAIGELADGLSISLDAVPKKYEGLDGTELALSESQERMAVVVNAEDVKAFKKLAANENLEATEIAKVKGNKRLKMSWRGKTIVNISREFIDTNGVRQDTDIAVTAPGEKNNYFTESGITGDIPTAWINMLKDLNICSQKGLVDRFDNSVGAGTVLIPMGGKYQLTPIEAMAAKVPVLSGNTLTCSLMSYGFNPRLSSWSPFHGAVYAVLESVAKIVATGGDYSTIRFSLQEYFEKLGQDPKRWGKPFSALLGAYHALTELGLPAIGGKDSMSGSFKDLDVPPTLIAFAVTTMDVRKTISPEFKKTGSHIVYIPLARDENHLPRFDLLREIYPVITNHINQSKILAARTIRNGGIAAAITEMALGNRTGFEFSGEIESTELFAPDYGSFLLEIPETESPEELFKGIDFKILGRTIEEPLIKINGGKLIMDDLLAAWNSTLEPVFPTKTAAAGIVDNVTPYPRRSEHKPAVKIARPRVLIVAFPGTNSEYDTQLAFERAGAAAEIMVFRNLSPAHISHSLEELRKRIDNSQIVVLPGGFSSGDEPDGSGKFITSVFRNPHVAEEVMKLLKQRDGLMLGICNGFQALIKLGLVPYGEICDMGENSPTLTFNQIGRHAASVVRTKVSSVLSPWFINMEPGDVHNIAVSHGEGRFIADDDMMEHLITNGQVATQYVDIQNNPTMQFPYNPNGSVCAVEGLTSPDGHVLGKMAHSERMSQYTFKNIPGEKVQKIFQSGVDYFS